MRHLTDFNRTVDCGEVTAQIPQLYFEKFTEHRLESLVEPSETEEETVLLLRTSFPPFVRLESTQVMSWKPNQPTGEGPFTGATIVVTFPFMTSTCFLSPVNGRESRWSEIREVS